MTRETKIGLLVGLAFIIVIGILLSDHLTSSLEPPLAQLAQAGPIVRQAVSAPGGQEPPVTAVQPPVRVAPEQPVPTAGEVTPAAPLQIVKIGPPANGASQPQTPAQPGPAPIIVSQTPQAPAGQPSASGAAPNTGTASPPVAPVLNEVARQHGEEVVAAGSASTPNQNPTPSATTRTYVAQPGDSLSKIASVQMGANSQANRDAILAANPFMKGNPNLIIAGRTYVIPGPSTAANASPRPAQPAPTQTATATHEHWYTCKAGDSLWKIAQDQLGEGASYTAIKELNKDVLKGGDTVVPGMRLRLPAKPLAAAD